MNEEKLREVGEVFIHTTFPKVDEHKISHMLLLDVFLAGARAQRDLDGTEPSHIDPKHNAILKIVKGKES